MQIDGLKPNKQIKFVGPSALPILGNIHQLGSKPLRTIQSWAYKYGPIYRIKIGNDLYVLLISQIFFLIAQLIAKVVFGIANYWHILFLIPYIISSLFFQCNCYQQP